MNNIDKILEELYLVDPGLRTEEPLIRKILSDMYAVRPDIVADPAFIASLRNTIIQKAHELSARPAKVPFSMFHSNKFAFASLALVAAVLASGLFFLNGSDRGSVAVNTLQENAFGPLAYQPVPGGRGGGGGGGGGGVMMSAPADASGKEMASPLIYPGPDYTQIKYIYNGGDFDLPSDGLVYKRRLDSVSAKSVLGSLKNFPVSKLKNPNIGDMTLVEDREFGYNITLSLREGWVSFFQNWEKWPMQDVGCSTEECYRRDFIAQPQFPSDDRVIPVADAFLKEYAINMSGYGAGEVIKPWKYNPMPAVDGQITYPPEVSVLYPLLIDGKKVYDEWGNVVGVNVGVNVKLNKVTNASNISVHRYDSSKYGLVSDEAKIMEIARNGGANGDVIIMGWEGKTKEVKMSSPEVVYMQFYMYSNGRSELMYVPAMRFPITELPADGFFYRENVIVPLAQDIIDQILQRRVVPPGAGGMPVPLDTTVTPVSPDAPVSSETTVKPL